MKRPLPLPSPNCPQAKPLTNPQPPPQHSGTLTPFQRIHLRGPMKPILRRLARAPMFTVVTLVTLAIGIGANTAIFSVLDGVLLKPLPYPQAEQLIAVDHKAPGVSMEHTGAAPFLYYTYREQNRTLQDVGMWQFDSVAVTGTAEPQQVDGIDKIGRAHV